MATIVAIVLGFKKIKQGMVAASLSSPSGVHSKEDLYIAEV